MEGWGSLIETTNLVATISDDNERKIKCTDTFLLTSRWGIEVERQWDTVAWRERVSKLPCSL